MNASALSILIADTKIENFLSNGRCLNAGDRLRGRVEGIKSNGMLLMDFGSFRASARVDFPVVPDETLHAVVLENKAQLRLGLINPQSNDTAIIPGGISRFEVPVQTELRGYESEIERVIRTNTPLLKTAKLPKEILSALLKVSAHFAPLKLNGNVSEIIGQLKRHTENSGIFFEKRLEQALTTLPEYETRAPEKNLSRFPVIKEILANDLKPVLWPLKVSLNTASAGTHFSGKQLPDAVRNMVEALIEPIRTQQECAVGREFRTGPEESPINGFLRGTSGQREPLLRLQVLIPQLIQKLKSYQRTSGGTVEKELEHAVIKTSESAKSLFMRILSAFDEHGGMQGKNSDARPILWNEFFEVKESMPKMYGGKTANNSPGTVFALKHETVHLQLPATDPTASLKTAHVRKPNPLQPPPAAQQSRQFNPIRHLLEPAAGPNITPNVSGWTGGKPAEEEPADPTASLKSAHVRDPNPLQPPPAARQSRQFNPIRHLPEPTAGPNIAADVSGWTGGMPAEEEPADPTASLKAGHVKEQDQLRPPPVAGQNRPFNMIHHLSEATADIKIDQQTSAASAERSAEKEPATLETSLKTGQPKQPIEWQGPAIFQQSLPFNMIRHLSEQTADPKVDQDAAGASPERPAEETVDPTSSPKTAQPKESAEFAAINRIINRDLMPGLLNLERYFDTKAGLSDPVDIKSRESLRHTVRELLSSLRHSQGQNKASNEPIQDQVQVFAYDFLIKENEQRAKLKIYYPRKKKGKHREEFKASLLLEMDKIGQIKTDFSLLEKRMNITFYVKNLEVKNTIENNLHKITPQLKEIAETLTIKVEVSENQEKHVENDWADVPSNSIIDVRI